MSTTQRREALTASLRAGLVLMIIVHIVHINHRIRVAYVGARVWVDQIRLARREDEHALTPNELREEVGERVKVHRRAPATHARPKRTRMYARTFCRLQRFREPIPIDAPTHVISEIRVRRPAPKARVLKRPSRRVKLATRKVLVAPTLALPRPNEGNLHVEAPWRMIASFILGGHAHKTLKRHAVHSPFAKSFPIEAREADNISWHHVHGMPTVVTICI